MFTGIIEEVNTVRAVAPLGNGRALEINGLAAVEDIAIGDSISVNGVCLTVIDFNDSSFRVEAVEETLHKSGIGRLRPDAMVNLERALRVGGKLGGHFVQGHVDCTATLVRIDQRAESWMFWFQYPPEHDANIIPVGSIAVDGVSLTIAEKQDDRFAVSVIPHTYANTLFRTYKQGSVVNIELDMIGKYVLQFLQGRESEGLSANRLRELGY